MFLIMIFEVECDVKRREILREESEIGTKRSAHILEPGANVYVSIKDLSSDNASMVR